MRTKEEILKAIAEKEMIFPVELSAKHYIQAMEQYRIEGIIDILELVLGDTYNTNALFRQKVRDKLSYYQNQLNQIK